MVTENNGILLEKDGDGDIHILLPATKTDNVAGLTELVRETANSVFIQNAPYHVNPNENRTELAGFFIAEQVASQNLSFSQIRNIYAGTADMTAGSSNLATGTIYLVYE